MWDHVNHLAENVPDSVRVVVVSAAGRSFSAGLDRDVVTSTGPDGLAALAARGPDGTADRIAQFQSAFGWLRRPGLVSVAAVQGHAVGAGFQLALACDLRVVADDAVFRMAEVTLGLVPDLGGTRRLLELVGYSRALELCITGRTVPAEEGDRIGLVSRLVPRADLDAATAETVATLLALDRDAVGETAELVRHAGDRSQSEQELAERRAQVRRLHSLLGH
jgi:enoyl-CoA hydratase/carnithine racemase